MRFPSIISVNHYAAVWTSNKTFWFKSEKSSWFKTEKSSRMFDRVGNGLNIWVRFFFSVFRMMGQIVKTELGDYLKIFWICIWNVPLSFHISQQHHNFEYLSEKGSLYLPLIPTHPCQEYLSLKFQYFEWI